jgi:hypothetical protein
MTNNILKEKLQAMESARTPETIKAIYRELAFLYHPDRNNGTTSEIMQMINDFFDEQMKRIDGAQCMNRSTNKSYTYKYNAADVSAFRNILNELYKLAGLTIELCGSWLWIDGNTYENRARLKDLGCHYSPVKKLWNWHYGKVFCKSHVPMHIIRERYGSQNLSNNPVSEAI